MPKRPSKGGLPPHVPTAKDRQMVEVMAGFGIPCARICLVLGIAGPTLWTHYRSEIERGSATVEAKLAGNLLRIASGSDGAAMKAITFALQCRFGWRFTVDPADPNAIVSIGKKEQAQIAAQTAGDATDWGDDLQTPATRPN